MIKRFLFNVLIIEILNNFVIIIETFVLFF